MNGRWTFLQGLLFATILILFPIGLLWWFRCGPPTTLLIVRHADRDGQPDVLNALGLARAQELVHVGVKAGLAAIYRSDTNRARDTAAPLALATGLVPIVYAQADTGSLVASIFADHRSETVLVVGHNNTVPDIIEAAGGPVIPDINPQEFDNLFVLTVCRCGRTPVRLTNLQYGASTD